MPDENAPALSQEDQNKQVAADLLKQGQETLPDAKDHQAAGDALDELAKGIIEKKEAAPDPGTPPANQTPSASAAPEPSPEEKAAAEAKAKADAEIAAAADKIFKDSPGLPPNASPKNWRTIGLGAPSWTLTLTRSSKSSTKRLKLAGSSSTRS
jgi:hypothetical protein